jgi:hypothetical protein
VPSQTDLPDVCEWPRCGRRAECEVNAQWTIVDFVTYTSCGSHARQMMWKLNRREIDGQLPADVWAHWFAVD